MELLEYNINKYKRIMMTIPLVLPRGKNRSIEMAVNGK